jgi:hypothetical protein
VKNVVILLRVALRQQGSGEQHRHSNHEPSKSSRTKHIDRSIAKLFLFYGKGNQISSVESLVNPTTLGAGASL